MIEHADTAHFGHFAARLNSFRGGSTTESTLAGLRLLASVPGITATELNYPQHFSDSDAGATIESARSLGLAVTALNLRFDPPTYARGAFMHPDSAVRTLAISLACEAVEIAARCEIAHVILWLGPDGYDYPFQVDYARLWNWAVEGLRRVAESNRAIQISIEPKPFEPRRHSMVRTVADALALVHESTAPNAGVTLDFCHCLMSGEQPASAASLALRTGRLFGIHLNDGYGPQDDGLMVGSVHPIQTLELLWTLRRLKWRGTIYFDTFPAAVDPASECATNIETVKRMLASLDRIDIDEVERTQRDQDGLAAARLAKQLWLP